MAKSRFVCELCKKGFQRDQNLQLHRRGHNLPWKLRQRTSETPKRVYICPEPSCVHHNPSRALGDLTGIKKHFYRKHGEKKWKCQRCSKKYAVQSDWKAHSKTCGTKEYKCDCGTIFSRRDSFITHRAFCDDALAEDKTGATQTQGANPDPKTLFKPSFPMTNVTSRALPQFNLPNPKTFSKPLATRPMPIPIPIPAKPPNIARPETPFPSSPNPLFAGPSVVFPSSLGLAANSLPQRAAQMGTTSTEPIFNSSALHQNAPDMPLGSFINNYYGLLQHMANVSNAGSSTSESRAELTRFGSGFGFIGNNGPGPNDTDANYTMTLDLMGIGEARGNNFQGVESGGGRLIQGLSPFQQHISTGQATCENFVWDI